MLQAMKKFRLGRDEREAMRAAGRFNAQLLDAVRPLVKAGVSTGEIDRMVHDYIGRQCAPCDLGRQKP